MLELDDDINEAAEQMADCMSAAEIKKQADTALEVGLIVRYMIEFDLENTKRSIYILFQHYRNVNNREMVYKLAELTLIWEQYSIKALKMVDIDQDVIDSLVFPLKYN